MAVAGAAGAGVAVAVAGVAVAVVSQGAEQKIRAYYENKDMGVPVLIDSNATISKGSYKVRAVPFFYVLDKSGSIAARRPFTASSARAALNSVLGLATDAGSQQQGAG